MVSAMGGPNLALCVQGRIFYSLTGFAGTKKAIGDSMLKEKSKNKKGLERKTFYMACMLDSIKEENRRKPIFTKLSSTIMRNMKRCTRNVLKKSTGI